MAKQGVRKINQTLGHTAAEHQLAGKHKEGNSNECDAVAAGKHTLDRNDQRHTAGDEAADGDNAQSKADRNADKEGNKQAENNGHLLSPFLPKSSLASSMSCSSI